ncbi:hypothetical protein V8C40DRAFT_249124 [Trichoderma camerunense]
MLQEPREGRTTDISSTQGLISVKSVSCRGKLGGSGFKYGVSRRIMQVSGGTKPRTRLQSTGGPQQTSYTTVRLVTCHYNPNPNPNFVRINVLRHSSQRAKLLGSTPYCAPYKYARHSAPHHQLALTRTSTRMSVSTQETRHPRALVRTIWEQQIFRQPQSLNHDGPAYHLTNKPPTCGGNKRQKD